MRRSAPSAGPQGAAAPAPAPAAGYAPGGAVPAAAAPPPADNIPRRPAPRQAPGAQAAGQPGAPQFHLSAGVGFFPSLFGLQFQVGEINTPRHPGPLSREEQQQRLMSQTLAALGVMIFIGLLFV